MNANQKKSPAASGTLLLQRAVALDPLLRADAPLGEASGKLTDKAFAALRDQGLLQTLIPQSLGGDELNALEMLALIETLSFSDGSTGWVFMATQVCTGIAAACLPPEGAAQLFEKGLPIVAGQGAPNGNAEVVKGGFRLSGSWSYGSGILHSNHIHTGGVVVENGKPRMRSDGRGPEIRTFIVPTHQAKMEGNWDVMGLRATGSVNYSITDVFVPEEFTHAPEAIKRYQGGNGYSIGIIGMTALGHTGFILGVGRRVLDELSAFVSIKPPGRGGLLPPLSATTSYQEGYGRAEARLRSARAFIFDAWGEQQKNIDRGDPPTTRDITLTRLALNHATSEIADLCAWAYKTAGGYSLRESALQRCFRDVYAGTQHFLVSPTILQECGRELAGLAKGEAWTLLGLRKP
ncbi:MAG: acyl-CoA dehydrogenase family protein [Burkholderiales bacterium]